MRNMSYYIIWYSTAHLYDKVTSSISHTVSFQSSHQLFKPYNDKRSLDKTVAFSIHSNNCFDSLKIHNP